MAVPQDEPEAEYVASTMVSIYMLKKTLPQRFIAATVLSFSVMYLLFSPNGLFAAPFVILATGTLVHYQRQTRHLVDLLTPAVTPFARDVRPKFVFDLMPALSTRSPRGWLTAADQSTAAAWFRAAVAETLVPPDGQTNCATGHYPGCPHHRPKGWDALLRANESQP